MTPTTDNIIARMPDFYHSGETENLLYKFVELFATTFDVAEEDLLSIMKMHWVKTADNVLLTGADTTVRGDLDKVFALYLDSLGATSLLKQGKRRTDTEGGKADDALYRQRILSVINVLKNGAATISGIIDIIAANLGIADDLPFAKEAKEAIDIVEFLPEATNSADPIEAKLFTPFTATNSSLVPAIAEFRLKLHTEAEVTLLNDKVALPPLLNARIRNLTTKEVIQLETGVAIKAGDEIIFLANGSALLRGQHVNIIGKKKITLPAGDSQLQFEAEVGIPEGRFDKNTYFDFAQFDKPITRQIGRFDYTYFDGIEANGEQFDGAVFNYEKSFAALEITYLRIFPGSFTAVVPWDIPGFSTVIKITQTTLQRLPLFGANPIVLSKIAHVKDIEFETIETFYMALLWNIGDFPAPSLRVSQNSTPLDDFQVMMSEADWATLRNFGVKEDLITTLKKLIKTPFKTSKDFYISLTKLNSEANNAFYVALFWKIAHFTEAPKVTDETELTILQTLRTAGFREDTIKRIKDAFLTTQADDMPLTTLDFVVNEILYVIPKQLDWVLQECEFKDKFTRFDINPRAQLHAIVNRVKAAGIYSSIAFEKRFWENQELEERLSMNWVLKNEVHNMEEGSFIFDSRQTNQVVHEMEETFKLSGVFDYTYFDSLNAFA